MRFQKSSVAGVVHGCNPTKQGIMNLSPVQAGLCLQKNKAKQQQNRKVKKKNRNTNDVRQVCDCSVEDL